MKDLVMDVAIYSRVSTASQSDEDAYRELVELADRCGWNIVESYREKVSGRKSAKDRPLLKQLLIDAKRRRFQKVIVYTTDRLGRDFRDLINNLSELKDVGCGVFDYKRGLDTATDMGSLLFKFLGIFAELENDLRNERVKRGIENAKARGVKFGRPSNLTEDKIQKVTELRAKGWGYVRIGKELGLGTNTVKSLLK